MTCAKIKLVFNISLVIMLASGAKTMVLASDAAGDSLSPDEVFKKSQETYASLASYSDNGEIVATMNGTITTTAFTIRLARTNFYYIEWKRNSEPADTSEKTFFQAAWSSGAGNFLEKGLGAQKQEDRDIALAKATEISGGAAGTIPRTFFRMQFGDQLGDSGFGESRQPDEQVGGVDCYVFSKELQGRTKTLWIGKQDFLIHQVRIVTSAEAMQEAAKWVPEIIAALHGFTATETHTNIVVNKQFLRSDFVPLNGE